MVNERLQGKEQLHSSNYFLEIPHSHAEMCLKSASQNLNFTMTKAISKSYRLDCSCKCPCTFPHNLIFNKNETVTANALASSRLTSFSIKTILCETNTFFSKNY